MRFEGWIALALWFLAIPGIFLAVFIVVGAIIDAINGIVRAFKMRRWRAKAIETVVAQQNKVIDILDGQQKQISSIAHRVGVIESGRPATATCCDDK